MTYHSDRYYEAFSAASERVPSWRSILLSQLERITLVGFNEIFSQNVEISKGYLILLLSLSLSYKIVNDRPKPSTNTITVLGPYPSPLSFPIHSSSLSPLVPNAYVIAPATPFTPATANVAPLITPLGDNFSETRWRLRDARSRYNVDLCGFDCALARGIIPTPFLRGTRKGMENWEVNEPYSAQPTRIRLVPVQINVRGEE